jgi:hypothetical protein
MRNALGYGLYLLTLTAFLFVAEPAVATDVHFHTQFANDTAVIVEAVILHSSGSEQKDRNVQPGEKEKFHFGLKCKKTHTRKFELYEKQNGTLIGSGWFTMETGKEHGGLDPDCKYQRFDLTCDDDPDTTDSFELSCSRIDESLVRIRIERPGA